MKFKGIIDMKKFIIAIIVALIIWSSVFILLWKKGTALQTDPCSLCAEFMGENVFCTTQTTIPLTRAYYPNGSIIDNEQMIREIINEETKRQYEKNFNLSYLDKLFVNNS